MQKGVSMKIDDIFQITHNEVWSKDRHISSGYRRKVVLAYNKDIKPHFGNKSFNRIKPKDVRAWHVGIGQRSIYSANRALCVLSKMYAHLIEKDIAESNPCHSIKKFVEIKRGKHASIDDIKRLEQVLEKHKEEFPRHVLFIYLLLYTGARPTTILNAKHEDLIEYVDNKTKPYGVLSVYGKTSADTGEKDDIIIPTKALKLIRELSDSRGEFIVQRRLYYQYFWEKVSDEAGLKGLWLRDLRRTFASLALSKGVSISVIAELLNHKSIQTTKRYAKLDRSSRLDAMHAMF